MTIDYAPDVPDELLDLFYEDLELEEENEICPSCCSTDNYVIYKSNEGIWIYKCACGHMHVILDDE